MHIGGVSEVREVGWVVTSYSRRTTDGSTNPTVFTDTFLILHQGFHISFYGLVSAFQISFIIVSLV